MANIKLFSGMDFSGKSTTIKSVEALFPNTFKIQSKFLTPIDTIQKMIDQNIWIPRHTFIPLLQKIVTKDILNYQENGLILQDTLWVIKFTARLLADDSYDCHDAIAVLLDLINQYPDMDSFYITTTLKERKKRYNIRKKSGKRITRSDKLILSKEIFNRTEKHYRSILLNRFPNTQIIDTTFECSQLIAEGLVNNLVFKQNI